MRLLSIILLVVLTTLTSSYASSETSSISNIPSSEALSTIDIAEMQRTREMVFKYMTTADGLQFLKGIVELKCFKKEFVNGQETRIATNTESCKVEKHLQREHIRGLLKDEYKTLTEEDREILMEYFVEVLT